MDSVVLSEKYFIKFSRLSYSRRYLAVACSFSAFNFVSTALGFSSVNCTNLMSNEMSIFLIDLSVTSFYESSFQESAFFDRFQYL